MKKILIIADGLLAKHFLSRIADMPSDSNEYVVVHYRKKTLPDVALGDNFKIYRFDPTSFEKMRAIIKEDFYQIMIATSKREDAKGSYENIRQFDKKAHIFIIDRWGLEIEDKYLTIVESKKLAAFRLADFLPNTPVIAQNIGLGIGEVMDVQVPVGSSYVYRHIGGIEQKKWQIAALYRNNMLHLPKPNLMIQPNDSLLIIGAPDILQNVYKSIKQDLGQFPLPFGSNIYCFIDMQKMSEKKIDLLLQNAKTLHERLNSKKLHIKIINPTYSSSYEYIRSLSNGDIEVNVDFQAVAPEEVYKQDVERMNIGLCVCENEFFTANMKMLYECQAPIFKNGKETFEQIKRSIIAGGNEDDAEKNSSVIFDISSQLDLKVQFYDFDPNREHNALGEHLENISKLYEKKIDIIKIEDKNPIFELKKASDFLQFVPFHSSLIKPKLFSMFSEDLNQTYFILSDKYQLFLPVLE